MELHILLKHVAMGQVSLGEFTSKSFPNTVQKLPILSCSKQHESSQCRTRVPVQRIQKISTKDSARGCPTPAQGVLTSQMIRNHHPQSTLPICQVFFNKLHISSNTNNNLYVECPEAAVTAQFPCFFNSHFQSLSQLKLN